MNYSAFLFGVLLVFVLGGCRPASQLDEHAGQRRQRGLVALKGAEAEARQLDGPQHRIAFWKDLLLAPPFADDSVLQAKIHYQLAGVYYSTNNMDSIKWHMRRAWSLIEREEGVEEMLVLFNVGEGNIATHEQLIHQANYYYNLAVSLMEQTDPVGLSLTHQQRAMIYLAAAQSDAGLHQYERAIARNQAAVRLLFTDTTVNVRLLSRAYDQLVADFLNVSEKRLDSARVYIQRMDTLAQRYPDAVMPRFLYDRKALYYGDSGNLDSSIYYHRAILDIDRKKVDAGQASPTDYANLFKDLLNLADRFVRIRQLDSATHYLHEGARFAEEHGEYLSMKEDILHRETLVGFYFASGRYSAAYAEHRSLLEATRKLNENKYAQAVAEMSAIYELQAKEKDILELNREVVVKEGELARNRLWLIITTLSALLAIAIVLILNVNRKQRKLRAEAERERLQRHAIELEQRLLRTQMEPHFIFNTLGALQSYIRLDEKEKALKYLKNFSRLLRNSLELSRENIVPLAEELETLEYYLALQRMRYEEKFDYRIDYHDINQEELRDWLIPPMLIQPFVENAIVHGMDGKQESGQIDVLVSWGRDRKGLMVTITDNGPGIHATADAYRETPKKKSLSTAISRERLEIFKKEQGVAFGVTVVDRSILPGNKRGTLVKLSIPVFREF